MGSQGQVDRAPDPLTHFADTRRRRPLVAHFGASAKSRHWAPNGLASSHPTMMRKAQKSGKLSGTFQTFIQKPEFVSNVSL